MQKKNVIRFASLATLALVIAGCGGKQSSSSATLVDTYNYIYTADPKTFDYLADYHSATFDVLANFVDDLLEIDEYGISQPALAQSYSHNADYTVWTFKLKQGLQWVTNDGSVYGEVVADDWVAGMQHLLDAQGGAEYIVSPVVNADEYIAGSVTDISQVGVKAVDKYTIEYTLEASTPYFATMVSYAPFFPMNREFFVSQGCSFGLDKYDATVCKFGVLGDPTSILYNGAYLLSEYVASSKMSYVANTKYWGASSITTKKVNLIFDDNSDINGRLTSFINGDYVATGVSASVLERAKKEIGDDLYITESSSCTYYGAFNLNRKLYESGTLKSNKTEAQKADTKKAILNKNFRKAILGAWDTAAQNSIATGEELKTKSLRNTIAAPGFVSMPEAYDGFAKGTDYTELVESYLKKKSGTFNGDISDGQAAYFNTTKAKEFAAAAKTELAAQGVSFPIVVDIMYYGNSENQKNAAASFKQGIEGALGADFVRIDTHAAATTNEYYYNGYYASSGDEVFYDFFYGSGWCPDYGDPVSYINIYGKGQDMMTHIAMDVDEAEDSAIYDAQLGSYNTLLLAAKAETTNVAKRYTLFAQAEAELIDSGVVIPYLTQGGTYAATRVIPHTVAYTFYGTDNSKYKWFKVTDHILTSAEVTSYREAWKTERAKRLAA